jgi:hypothetical protein
MRPIMQMNEARALAVVCVILVTATCVGCYKPAAGGSVTLSTSSAAVAPKANPSPTSEATPSASPSASKPDAVGVELAASVAAALKNPTPNMRPAVLPSGTGQRVASRSPTRSPIRTKVLDAPQAASGIIPLTFDDLIFPLEKDQPFVESLLTPKIRDLFGQKIKIRGYIHPSCPFQTGVTSFILVRDDQSCCFGPGAALYDCIIVKMLPGRSTNFSAKPIAVEGVLKFQEFKDLDGKHLAIYHLDGEAVE